MTWYVSAEVMFCCVNWKTYMHENCWIELWLMKLIVLANGDMILDQITRYSGFWIRLFMLFL